MQSSSRMVLYNSEWVWQRVKRFIPPPEILAPRVLEVIQKYGPLQDAVTGQSLFNKASWEAARTVLENVRQGYLYRCARGTNNVEGGVHRNIIKRFGSYNASAQFSTNLLRDYNLCRNLKVGYYNRTRQQYQGSFDIWTRNRLSRLLDRTTHAFVRGASHSMSGWVNGNDYERSSETFGILPVREETQQKLSMLPYHSEHATTMKIHHSGLAKQMLIHRKDGHFTGPSPPNWIAIFCGLMLMLTCRAHSSPNI